MSAETVHKYSFMSELLPHWLILSMLETRYVGRAASIVQVYKENHMIVNFQR